MSPLLSHAAAMPHGPIDALRAALVPAVVAEPGSRRGQPSAIPGAMLWAGMLTGILRGEQSQRVLWRLMTTHGLWPWSRIATLSDDAIHQRLRRTGPAPTQQSWTAVTAHRLAIPAGPTAQPALAPFATVVMARDETTLDQVRRQGARREVPVGTMPASPARSAPCSI